MELEGSSPGAAIGLSCNCETPLSASLSTNLGSVAGGSGDGDAAVLGDLGSPSGDVDVGIESLVFARLEAKPITGVGRSWNVVRASERSPSLKGGPNHQALSTCLSSMEV